VRTWLLPVLALLPATTPVAGQVPIRPVPQIATPSTPSGTAPAPHRIVPVEEACLDTPTQPPKAPDNEPYAEGEVDHPPELITPGPRRYPADLNRAKVGGRVVLSFVIDTLGQAEPCSFHVVFATNPGFEVPAFRMALNSTFRPAVFHGQKVRVLVLQAVTFNP